MRTSVAFVSLPTLLPARVRLTTSRFPTCSQSAPRPFQARIPLLLTYARVAAIPVLCTVQHPPSCAVIFACTSITDFFDGYLARKWNAITPMGIFLDPVADKLLVAAALTLIVARFPTRFVVSCAAAILCREIFVSALREWMALKDVSSKVKVSFWGKLKTACQMLALTVLLGVKSIHSVPGVVGLSLLLVASVLSLLSASGYVSAAWPYLAASPDSTSS